MSVFPKLAHKFNMISIRMPSSCFLLKLIIKFILQNKQAGIAKKTLKKRNMKNNQTLGRIAEATHPNTSRDQAGVQSLMFKCKQLVVKHYMDQTLAYKRFLLRQQFYKIA